MLELYQFELSHYSEKVRLLLDYKGLAYRKIEITPGIGQVDLSFGCLVSDKYQC
jgi:glutathione S-transferase